MQIFAYDSEGELVHAGGAKAGQDYRCMECDGRVRRRSGRIQPHFFHRGRPKHCRQRGKSLLHLQIQRRVQTQLPPGECQMEHPFPSIARIADLYWPKKKLVFEVQCSPITAEEVEGRNADYGSLGLEVVWILHDWRFNRRRVTEAERFLWSRPHYYTNIDRRGRGYFYDCLRLYPRGWLTARLPRMAVELYLPLPFFLDGDAPPQLKKWGSERPFCFSGDLLYHWQHGTLDPATKEHLSQKPGGARPLGAYRRLLARLIERAYSQ